MKRQWIISGLLFGLATMAVPNKAMAEEITLDGKYEVSGYFTEKGESTEEGDRLTIAALQKEDLTYSFDNGKVTVEISDDSANANYQIVEGEEIEAPSFLKNEEFKLFPLRIDNADMSYVWATDDQIYVLMNSETEPYYLSFDRVDGEDGFYKAIDNINVRSLPSTEADLMGALEIDDTIEVKKIEDGWAEIEFESQPAYINADYIEKVNLQDEAEPETERIPNISETKLYYAQDNLNIRNTPSTDSEVVGTLENGDEVRVISKDAEWAKILHDGTIAYVASSYLKSDADVKKEAAAVVPITSTVNQSEDAEVTREIPQERMVWIPQSGSKYHSNPSCSNMRNPSQVSISQAQSWGYEPCKKCY